ncbi:MAG: putative membrane protein YdjX (TVP38/TMEM64 family) [Myxococcota bacterium]|jgi:uncharacterized membrane protein YdjX (TVP38/TMEM64 family)
MEASPSGWQRWRKSLIVSLVVVAVMIGAQALRLEVGMEWSAESIRETVSELGWLAPAGFIVLVMFRQVMVLPSMLVLTSAGLLFGAPLGTLYGGIGLTLNALILFLTARLLGRDWVLPRLRARYPDFERHANTAGPMVIALMTGHPMGVLTPFHLAAGITGISGIRFLAVVGTAAIFRAACFSFLGANLLDFGSPRFWLASGLLVGVALLPLAHPGLRAKFLAETRKPDDDPAEPDTRHPL